MSPPVIKTAVVVVVVVVVILETNCFFMSDIKIHPDKDMGIQWTHPDSAAQSDWQDEVPMAYRRKNFIPVT